MIYKFRVVLDLNEEDIFRDIEIKDDATFEELHNSIVQSCDLDGQQMASFYMSNDKWEQKEEITLFDLSEEGPKTEEAKKVMADWALLELINEEDHKLLYIYDFFSMWTFYVELLDTTDEQSGVEYPRMVTSIGLMPEDAPEKDFTANVSPKSMGGEYDIFDGDDSFDQAGYEEFNDEWN
ncbi:MAG: hypothetical protein KAG96_07245 [Ichthyobacteriaceae bacterium]|nr:hypothetical protein [Ichthyobacteriaceae bacterium]